MSDGELSGSGLLATVDLSTIPAEPSDDILYHHHARLFDSLRLLWQHREIVFTLAERDFRAQYKQATLGVMWALLSPVMTLVIFVIIFSRAKGFGHEGVPFALFSYVGILCWSFFSTALGSGGNSLLANKALLSKTQFPRECFPFETMLVTALNTVLSWIPLAILFVIFGRAPAWTTVFVPLMMLIEVLFAAGVTLAVAGMIIQIRDLVQVLPVLLSLGMFANPVIWPFSALSHELHPTIPAWVQPVYSFLNPLGPVIDGARTTMLLGHAPDWGLLGLATLGAITYAVLGYKLFKRLEVQFADIA